MKLEKEKYRYGIINGSVPPYERDVIIKDMSYDILPIQIIAGGTGLNLNILIMFSSQVLILIPQYKNKQFVE